MTVSTRAEQLVGQMPPFLRQFTAEMSAAVFEQVPSNGRQIIFMDP